MKCDANLFDRNHRTPLHLAAMSGQHDTVKYLVEEKKCNPVSKEISPLHLASQLRHLDLVKYLALEKHCNASIGDHNVTPLRVAALKLMVECKLLDS